MPPKAELVPASIVREREWAYALWMERRLYSQIRRIANLSEADGGLGYDLSESALKGLVQKAREDRGDLTMGRDERIERQSAELDELGRHLRDRIAYAASIEAMDAHAIDRLLAVQKAERDLHGLAAPVVARLDVVHYDALAEELNAMLGRAGAEPMEIPRD